MPSARDWHIGHLAVAWLLVPVVILAVRAVLAAGVYEAAIEGQRVTILAGHWSSSFASAVTVGFGAVAVSAAAWLTLTWFTGSRERRRAATMIGEPHRRPLM